MRIFELLISENKYQLIGILEGMINYFYVHECVYVSEMCLLERQNCNFPTKKYGCILFSVYWIINL